MTKYTLFLQLNHRMSLFLFHRKQASDVKVDQILLKITEMHRNDIKSTEIKSDVSFCMCEST